MATATKFDIKKSLDKTLEGATKPLYAGVGVTDLAVERVRDYAAEVQKSVRRIDFQPAALRGQATTIVNDRVDALSQDAKAFPGKVQALVDDTYGTLVARGEGLVTRVRRQESTKATTSAAKTTTAKAKTTKTQAGKATKSTAKKSASTAKKTAAKKSAPAKSSAKATGTAAKKTATAATQATTDAAAKVGD